MKLENTLLEVMTDAMMHSYDCKRRFEDADEAALTETRLGDEYMPGLLAPTRVYEEGEIPAEFIEDEELIRRHISYTIRRWIEDMPDDVFTDLYNYEHADGMPGSSSICTMNEYIGFKELWHGEEKEAEDFDYYDDLVLMTDDAFISFDDDDQYRKALAERIAEQHFSDFICDDAFIASRMKEADVLQTL